MPSPSHSRPLPQQGPFRRTSWSRSGGEQNALGTTALTPNTWTHLAVSFDRATLRLYANGALAGSKAVAGAITPTTGALRIRGNNIWSEWFHGLIDEVRIYNRALSQTEIQSDMSTPLTP